MKPSYIIFSGLSGCGKTTIARRLAKELGAVYLRADTMEGGIISSVLGIKKVEDAGYQVGYAVAAENLGLGNSVIADSVNSANFTRDDWRNASKGLDVNVYEIEMICSDKEEHKQRIETRPQNITNRKNSTWEEVLKRENEVWNREHIIIDTAGCSIDESLDELLTHIKTE